MPMLATLLAAACFWSGDAPIAPRAETMTVQMSTLFDRSIKSRTIKKACREEATAVWQPYGVDLVWSDEELPGSMRLNVNVVRQHGIVNHRAGKQVLGVTMMEGSEVRGPIRLKYDELESLLHQRQGFTPGWSEWEVGRALGRVLAHEIGHVLLGREHDPDGLMRASIPIEDFARLERRRFQLA